MKGARKPILAYYLSSDEHGSFHRGAAANVMAATLSNFVEVDMTAEQMRRASRLALDDVVKYYEMMRAGK